MAQNGFPNFVDVAAGREVHYRVGAVVDSSVQFLKLFIIIRRDRAVTDVCVDLTKGLDANAHGLKFGMIDVRWNDHPTASNFVAYQFWGNLLALGTIQHFFSDYALPSVVHLREIAVGVFRFPALDHLSPDKPTPTSFFTISVFSLT